MKTDRLFENWFNSNYNRIINDVFNYISIDTVTPNEENAFCFFETGD